MSPEAIRSMIDLLGVEHGIRMVNVFTAPDDWDVEGRTIRLQTDREEPDHPTSLPVMCSR